MKKTEDKFLTLEEAAKHLRVSKRSLYRYISEKRLKAIKVGYWRIYLKDLEVFKKKNSNI